jgi:hypothetical protein
MTMANEMSIRTARAARSSIGVALAIESNVLREFACDFNHTSSRKNQNYSFYVYPALCSTPAITRNTDIHIHFKTP